MIYVDVRSYSWLSIPLKLSLLPSSCTVRKVNGAGCEVGVTAASCSLCGTRCLLSDCWQYPDTLGFCGNSG